MRKLFLFSALLAVLTTGAVGHAVAQDAIEVKLTQYEIKQLNGIASRDKAVYGMLHGATITKTVVGRLKGPYMIWYAENVKAYESAIKQIDKLTKKQSCNDLFALALNAEPNSDKVNLFRQMASARGCD